MYSKELLKNQGVVEDYEENGKPFVRIVKKSGTGPSLIHLQNNLIKYSSFNDTWSQKEDQRINLMDKFNREYHNRVGIEVSVNDYRFPLNSESGFHVSKSYSNYVEDCGGDVDKAQREIRNLEGIKLGFMRKCHDKFIRVGNDVKRVDIQTEVMQLRKHEWFYFRELYNHSS